jgi:hypothetical protein
MLFEQCSSVLHLSSIIALQSLCTNDEAKIDRYRACGVWYCRHCIHNCSNIDGEFSLLLFIAPPPMFLMYLSCGYHPSQMVRRGSESALYSIFHLPGGFLRRLHCHVVSSASVLSDAMICLVLYQILLFGTAAPRRNTILDGYQKNQVYFPQPGQTCTTS